MANNTINDYSVGSLTPQDHLLFQAGSANTGVTYKKPANLESVVDKVVIKQESDFGTLVGDAYTLQNGVHYFLDAPITTTNRFELPANGLVQMSMTAAGNGITYLGAGTLFTGASVLALSLEDISLQNGGTGTLFNLTGDGSTFPSVQLRVATIAGWASLGTLTNINPLISVSNFLSNVLGLSVSGATVVGVRSSGFLSWLNAPTAFISLSGTVINAQLNDNLFSPGSNEYVVDIDASIVTLGIAVSGNLNNAQGRFFDPSGLDHTNKLVTCLGNSNVKDSTTQGHATFQNNATTTVISAIGRPEKIQGTFIEHDAERVTTTAAGRMTYVGLEDVNLFMSAAISPEIATGSKIACAFYINHGNDTNNTISSFADAGGGQVTVSHAVWDKHTIVNGDKIVITGTTNYNGTYTVTNVVAGVSFEITATFLGDDATGNWSVIDAISRRVVALTNGEAASVTMVHDEEYSTNEFIELFVENNGSTANITTTDCILIWRK